MIVKVYGIKNCNTMKKTFQLLDERDIPYDFMDYKKEKPSLDLLKGFSQKVGLAHLINKRGTTFRKLSEDEKASLESEDTAFPLLIDNSSMIKRPILQFPDGHLVLGLQEEEIIENARAGNAL